MSDGSRTGENLRQLIVVGDALLTALPRLTVSGFRVVGHGATAQQANELLPGTQPDVALVDVETDADPADSLRAVRALTTHPVAVVAAAGSYLPDLAQRAMAAGATTFLTAPFTPQRLMPALELAIARHTDTANLRNAIVDISKRLDDHIIIERAKGLLMFRYRITESEASRAIEIAATDRQTSRRAVATSIIQRGQHVAGTRGDDHSGDDLPPLDGPTSSSFQPRRPARMAAH